MIKKEDGITLVALVITIIILLILAGITIAKLTEYGLIEKAKLAKNIYTNSQEYEDEFLKEYENEISKINKENEINDLDIKITDILYPNIKVNVEINQKYDNAEYVYILNNKIIARIKNNIIEIGKNLEEDSDTQIENTNKIDIILEPNTKYEITVIVENEGIIHKGKKEFTTREESIDIFKELEKNGENIEKLSEYGISYIREGYAEFVYDNLYQLGMGSDTGTNSNTFTLTIDYNTLISKFNNKNFKGIYGKFHQQVYLDGGGGAWVYSKIDINYDDGSIDTIETKRTNTGGGVIIDKEIANLYFKEGKQVQTIKMIIYMYEGTRCNAFGWIENIGLIP